MPTVFVPVELRKLTGDADRVSVAGTNVRQVVENLEAAHPGIKSRLCAGGDLRPGLAVAVDGAVSTLGMLQKVGEASEVHFLPAVGGG